MLQETTCLSSISGILLNRCKPKPEDYRCKLTNRKIVTADYPFSDDQLHIEKEKSVYSHRTIGNSKGTKC